MENKNIIEVSREVINSFVMCLKTNQDRRKQAVVKENIDLDSEKETFPLPNYLKVLEDLGGNMLFSIGKAITEMAKFPPMNGFEEALRSIDIAFHMNHVINGKAMFNPENGRMREGIGHYKLTEFNEVKRFAIMVCDNPYPSDFDRGILTEIARKFGPRGARVNVELDKSKETRSKGGKSCTYRINW